MMTKEEALQIRLDIAVKVMGESSETSISGNGELYAPRHDNVLKYREIQERYEQSFEWAHAALRRITNKKDKDGKCRWYWRVESDALGYNCTIWYAGGDTSRPRLEDIQVKCSGDTEAEATCKAILKVVEAKEKRQLDEQNTPKQETKKRRRDKVCE